MEEDKLIDEVAKRRLLYDKNDPNHHSKERSTIAWHDIAGKLNTHPDEAKRKWTNLRDYFRRQIKEQQTKVSAEYQLMLKRRKKWVHFDRMKFLVPHMTSGGLPDDSPSVAAILPDISSDDMSYSSAEDVTTCDNELDIKPPPSEPLHAEELHRPTTSETAQNGRAVPADAKVDDGDTGVIEKSVSARGTKRKSEESSVSQTTELLTILKGLRGACDVGDNDDDELFFRSCLPMVRLLSAEQKLEFRISLQQQLLRYMREKQRQTGSKKKNLVYIYEDNN